MLSSSSSFQKFLSAGPIFPPSMRGPAVYVPNPASSLSSGGYLGGTMIEWWCAQVFSSHLYELRAGQHVLHTGRWIP